MWFIHSEHGCLTFASTMAGHLYVHAYSPGEHRHQPGRGGQTQPAPRSCICSDFLWTTFERLLYEWPRPLAYPDTEAREVTLLGCTSTCKHIGRGI